MIPQSIIAAGFDYFPAWLFHIRSSDHLCEDVFENADIKSIDGIWEMLSIVLYPFRKLGINSLMELFLKTSYNAIDFCWTCSFKTIPHSKRCLVNTHEKHTHYNIAKIMTWILPKTRNVCDTILESFLICV